MLRLTFLGTGTSQGVPMIACCCEVCRSTDERDRRLRSSVMIEDGTTRIIIDSGPDFRYQMLREGIRDIDAILLTHQHTDHIIGLDDVRAFNYFCDKPIPIYATAAVEAVVRKNFDYAFGQHRYPGVPDITLKTIDEAPFRVGTMEITPILGRHFRMPVTGFRVGNIAYLTDFNHIDEAEMEKLRGLDIFIVNALRHQQHLSHYSLPEAIELAQKIGAKRSYFTHISHQLGLHAVEEPKLPEGMYLAYDTLTIETR